MIATHRAILIQNISEYVSILKPHILQLMEIKKLRGYNNFINVLKWIISEELELIYMQFVKGHIHNHSTYSFIHRELESNLPFPLSSLTGSFIKAPKIYGDDLTIEIDVTEYDLSIRYYTDVFEKLFREYQLK